MIAYKLSAMFLPSTLRMGGSRTVQFILHYTQFPIGLEGEDGPHCGRRGQVVSYMPETHHGL
jgi:hypothetical protein